MLLPIKDSKDFNMVINIKLQFSCVYPTRASFNKTCFNIVININSCMGIRYVKVFEAAKSMFKS